ncbi:sensor domain-containing diguanylate cyclase [Metabacillus hrfriensis]|uniref:Sensor domain-containing diguanylate cyclase n=1 Tax=Metabacillus hrfriensis TaxID=3048891 RepID=A0ACD4R987_9BACI|nr:sensor domain-containing diguanylate cyclase [Metabacillus sp. CT-WN-B3]WHZ56702.1 sensor domain-containing diguanylate cyclase [Metabacillus sp. CT-WN-B3]
MEKNLKIVLWVSWAILFPAALCAAYYFWPPMIAGNELAIATFLLLMCIVSIFPIIVNETPVFFAQGVSISVFLLFGPLVEMILMQISLTVLLIKLRVGLREIHRYPTNSLMFLIVSVAGAAVYYAIGGTHGQTEFTLEFLTKVIIYAFTICLTNHFFLQHVIRGFFYKNKEKFFSKDFLWEIFTTLMFLPVGIMLYILYEDLGLEALFYVGIPFVGISFILLLLSNSQRLNSYLQQASEIGHQLTERLEVKEVMDVYIDKLTSMINADYAYIIDVVNDYELKVIRKLENGQIVTGTKETISVHHGISGLVYAKKKSVLYKKREHWAKLEKTLLPETIESLIGVPIVRNQKVVGIVVLASNKKRSYDYSQLMIVDLLTAYLGVAIDNARSYEETKKQSERCALTGLFNYRYMEKLLESEYFKLGSTQLNHLSLILLDIDHFKKVNDTYGHQAGNEILIALADRLVRFIGERGTVARYGGEEFVILLPNVDKMACFAFAEGIRKTIANRPFMIDQDIQTFGKRHSISITASIGYATAPYDAEGPLDLIRHADRAMYIGAKQAGRNRVAEYVK